MTRKQKAAARGRPSLGGKGHSEGITVKVSDEARALMLRAGATSVGPYMREAGIEKARRALARAPGRKR